ncbi:MAG: DUF1559 domain-containing protein [Planctomyces sp.]|jgi:prepilin-type N-terminal cleavage/methylation domain-containing protein
MKRRGFTVIELLVVTALIGLLIAILLPGIHAARESARTVQCRNNLRQIGIALQNYHSDHGKFPPSRLNVGVIATGGRTTGGPPLYTNASGWTMLLPYLDRKALYDRYHHSQAAGWSWFYGGYLSAHIQGNPSLNYGVVSQVLPVLLCPSDSANPLNFAVANQLYGVSSTLPGGARTNYDFNIWSGEAQRQGYAFRVLPIEQRAMFASSWSTGLQLLTDGASNTAMVTETIRNVWNGQPPAWGHAHHLGVGIDLSRYPINTWVFGPNNPVFLSMRRPGRLADWGTAGSLHAGGCFAVFADGAVHFLSEGVDAGIRRNLHTISDGNPISSF